MFMNHVAGGAGCQETGSLVLVPGCDLTADQPWHWVIDTTAGVAAWHGHPDDPVETVSIFPGQGRSRTDPPRSWRVFSGRIRLEIL